MSDYVFAYFLDAPRPAYLRQFRLHLHTLRTRGGRAAGYRRFLMYGGPLTGDEGRVIREFTDREEVELVQVDQPFRDPFDNKLLMCRVPEGEVACLMDLDTVFLDDPTPAFDEAAAHDALLAIPGPRSPVRRLSSRPWLAGANEAFDAWGRRAWRDLFRKHAPGRPEPPLIRNLEEKLIYPYFNGGVVVVPRKHLLGLEEVCRQVTADLQEEGRRHGLTARLLCLHHTDQMALGIGAHALGLEWRPLSYLYNFTPGCTLIPELSAALEAGEAKVLHLVTSTRRYLEPNFQGEVPEHLRTWVRLARELAAELDPSTPR
jgi:hypothetical protein